MYSLYSTKYITKQGDTWDNISQAFYDNPYKTAELISVNNEFASVLIFKQGIELNIPILESSSPESLPPWKRSVT